MRGLKAVELSRNTDRTLSDTYRNVHFISAPRRTVQCCVRGQKNRAVFCVRGQKNRAVFCVRGRKNRAVFCVRGQKNRAVFCVRGQSNPLHAVILGRIILILYFIHIKYLRSPRSVYRVFRDSCKGAFDHR